MKIKYNDKISGTTQTDIINKLFSKNYKLWLKSYYILDKDSNIWLVKLDGSKNGHRKNYKWTNSISGNEQIITTNLISDNTDYIKDRMRKVRPNVYVFALDKQKDGLVATYKGLYCVSEPYNCSTIKYLLVSKEDFKV